MKPDTYTPFPNDILEALYKSDMSGSTLRVALLIYRYTYGFHRRTAKLTVSYIAEGTGLHPRTVSKALAWLIDHGQIDRLPCPDGRVTLPVCSSTPAQVGRQENKDKKENQRKKDKESDDIDDIQENNCSTDEGSSSKPTGYRF